MHNKELRGCGVRVASARHGQHAASVTKVVCHKAVCDELALDSLCSLLLELYVKSAALGARVKKNDHRSIDIGIATADLTAEAAARGLSTCILGWFDNDRITEICHLDAPARLVITLGYAAEGDKLREKKRKEISDLVSYVE